MATKYLLQMYFYLQKTHTNTFLLLQSVLPDLLPSSMKGPNERTDTIRKVNKVKAVITIITVILSWFHLIPCTTCMVHSEWSNKKKIFPRHPTPQKNCQCQRSEGNGLMGCSRRRPHQVPLLSAKRLLQQGNMASHKPQILNMTVSFLYSNVLHNTKGMFLKFDCIKGWELLYT